MNTHYDTLSAAYNELNKRGYQTNFEAIPNKLLQDEGTEETYSPAESTIVEFHRFEGSTNPSDMSILYAIETSDGKKGILLDAYGADSSQEVAEFIKEVKIAK
tara:strand:+ start:2082 stop:2390 length:309 start_codon:yes stop_codon:yes gene_type:complete